jgi:hypothetical protein
MSFAKEIIWIACCALLGHIGLIRMKIKCGKEEFTISWNKNKYKKKHFCLQVGG